MALYWRRKINEDGCLRPCTITQFTGDVEEKEYEAEDSSWGINLMIRYPSNSSTYLEEFLTYDFLGMIGSVGGSLGICVGISIFDVLSMIIDKIFGVWNKYSKKEFYFERKNCLDFSVSSKVFKK